MAEAEVVAKFVVTKIVHSGSKDYTQVDVTLQPRGETALPEDKRFHAATPSGQIDMTITNREAVKHFAIGKIFYVNFVPAPEGTSEYHT